MFLNVQKKHKSKEKNSQKKNNIEKRKKNIIFCIFRKLRTGKMQKNANLTQRH